MAKNKNKKAILLLLLIAVFSYISSAYAVTGITVGDIAKEMIAPVKSIGNVYVIFCYVAGLILTIMGCFKLKEYSDTKGQSKFSSCVLYIVGGTLLLAFPTSVKVGKEMMGLAGSANIHPDAIEGSVKKNNPTTPENSEF